MFDLGKTNKEYTPLKKPLQPNISPGPRISLLPKSSSQKSQSITLPETQQLNSNSTIRQHNPSLLEKVGSFFGGIGKAFKSGGENSPMVTGLTKLALGKQYNATPTPTPYTPQNGVEGLASTLGEQASEWPLWMAGGAISKGVMGATKLSPLMSKLPGAIKTGIDAGITYGGAVAPMETALQGDGLQGLANREKNVPAFMLGGTALHGAGQLIGKGLGRSSEAIAGRISKLNLTPLEKANKDLTPLSPKVEAKPIQPEMDLQAFGQKPLTTVKGNGILKQGDNMPKYTVSRIEDAETGIPISVDAFHGSGGSKDQIYNKFNVPVAGEGKYYALDKETAKSYGKKVTSEKLALDNPLVISDDYGWESLLAKAKLEGNNPAYLENEVDMKAWAKQLQDYVKGEGHDGLVLNFDKDGYNPSADTLYDVFGHDQVVSYGKEMNLQKFAEKPQPEMSIKGEIPKGQVESGVSRNLSTDTARPTQMQDHYWENPLSYESIANKESLAKAQAIFDEGLEPAITKLSKLHEEISPEAPPLTKLIADELYRSGNAARADELISEGAARATQAGQYGQAWKILRSAEDSTAFNMTVRKQLNKLNKEGLEQYGKKWNNVDMTPEEVTAIGKIKAGDKQSFEALFEKIQARIANEMPSDAWEKINAWRHISMLLNPRTQIRNVLGNGIMMTMRKSAQRVSGILQKVALKESDRTQVVSVKKEFKDLAREHFEANKKDLLAGGNKYQEGIKLGMLDKRVFKNNALEKVRKFNYELLQKGDNPFFENAYVDRLASYAQAKGIKDFTKLDQKAFDTAKLEAEQATYKDASDLATYLNKLKHPPKDAGIGTKAIAGAVEAALPFTKTPINIIKRGVQYSPVSILTSITKLKSAEGIDQLAKGLTGTGILGLGYLLASKGILTGKASKDADLKAYDANTGNSPFSILRKYSYDWAQPFSIPLSSGVEIYNALKDNPDDVEKMNNAVLSNDDKVLTKIAELFNGVYDAVAASGDTVFNMSVLKGAKTLLANPNGITAGVAQLPLSYATQFIPTFSNQIAGQIDPTVRQTYVKGNVPETAKNMILGKIPFASKNLQPKQTPYGEDVKRIENPLGRAFAQFISPGIIAKDQGVNPKIDTELRRLNEYGLTKQFPTMVENFISGTQKHPKIMLTPAEQTQYQKRTGELTLVAFGKAMKASSYTNAKDSKKKNMTADEVKAGLLASAIEEAKAQAKKEILKSKGFK